MATGEVGSGCWGSERAGDSRGQSDSAEALANSRDTEVLQEYLVLDERQVDHVDTGLI